MKALIIDNDPDDRQLFCDALRKVNDEIVCISFATGQEGLNYLREIKDLPKYVFLDIQIDEMDGKECLLRIKRIKHVEKVNVVIYSSSCENENEIQLYKKLGAAYVMIKPSTFKELCEKLSVLFNGSSAMA